MTKRQADLIISLLAAVLFAVVIVGASVLRGLELTRNEIAQAHSEASEARREAMNARKEAEAAQDSSMEAVEMLKRSTPSHAPIPLPGRRGDLLERGYTPAPMNSRRPFSIIVPDGMGR